MRVCHVMSWKSMDILQKYGYTVLQVVVCIDKRLWSSFARGRKSIYSYTALDMERNQMRR